MQNIKHIKDIVDEFKRIKDVKAIALGGSIAANTSDSSSDYDIYIYSDTEIDIQKREIIAKTFSDKYEINNSFFGPGDEWHVKNSNLQIDLMYRTREWMENSINNTWINCIPSVGYSTCFVYNLKNSIILYDPEEWYKNLQKKVCTDYPDKLSENIINNNLPLLKNKISASFYEQVKKAINREDYVSLNHRISAFLASYFDTLFAINKVLHPGEKRLIQYAKTHCKKLPEDFEEDINNITKYPLKNTLEILSKLNNNIVKLI